MRLKGLQILNGSLFKRVKLSSSSFVSNSVILLVSDLCLSANNPFVGFIVTKKNGCAVKRNFLKRRLRNIAVKIIANCGEKMRSYILIARHNLLSCSFAELERDVLYCLKNAAKNKK